MRKNRRRLTGGRVLHWLEVGSGLMVDCCLMLAVVGAGFLFAMALSDRPLDSAFLWFWCGLMLVFGGGLLPGRGLGYRLVLVGASCGLLVVFVQLT